MRRALLTHVWVVVCVALLASPRALAHRFVDRPQVLVKRGDEVRVEPVSGRQFYGLFGARHAWKYRFADAKAERAAAVGHRADEVFREYTAKPSTDVQRRYFEQVRGGQTADLHTARVLIPGAEGVGVFASTPIERDQFVGLYTGLASAGGAGISGNSRYTFAVDTPEGGYLLADGAAYRNVTSHINHSGDPNVAFGAMSDGKHWYVGMFARRPIRANEQLFINYGAGYWRHLNLSPVDLWGYPAVPFSAEALERAGRTPVPIDPLPKH